MYYYGSMMMFMNISYLLLALCNTEQLLVFQIFINQHCLIFAFDEAVRRTRSAG